MEAEARARFLASAARHCATSSPGTSAHLMLQRIELENAETKAKRKDDQTTCCRACGTILIPGWTSRKIMTGQRRSREPKPTLDQKKDEGKSKMVSSDSVMEEECMVCRRVTKTPVPKKPRLRVSRSLLQNSSARTGITSSGVASESIKSRNRKRRLKALLDKSKEEEAAKTSSTTGLDLMDLMRAT